MKIVHEADYSKLRAKAYPSLTEFADAMFWAQAGDKSKLDEYFKKIKAVKTKFPKPNRG